MNASIVPLQRAQRLRQALVGFEHRLLTKLTAFPGGAQTYLPLDLRERGHLQRTNIVAETPTWPIRSR